MVYLPQPHPRENPNTERKVPLENSIGKEQHPSIIENKNPATSRKMISIRKERNPHQRHQENASIVEKQVISRKSVEIRPNPLSTLQLVTKLARMRSLNSQNLTTQKVSLQVVLVTKRSISYTSHPLNPLEPPLVPLVVQMLVWHAKFVGTRLSMFLANKKSLSQISQNRSKILLLKPKSLANSMKPQLGKLVNLNQGSRNPRLTQKRFTIGLPNPRRKLQSTTFNMK